MIARIESFFLQGIEAQVCEVEVDLASATLPRTTIVGLPDAAVRESLERVRTALHNRGYRFPGGRLTVNLAPANVRKEGPVYDLPMALAILRADGTIRPPAPGCPDPDQYMIAGELALDGRVRAVRGGISLGLLARKRKRTGILVPAMNAAEAAAVGEITVHPVMTLADAVAFFNGVAELPVTPAVELTSNGALMPGDVNFADIRGQETAKRALTVAAAGHHNVALIGPAGTGKTMMAKALPGILPPLTREEALEVTSIYSAVGAVPQGEGLVRRRPVRTPHHTASPAAIIGGGSMPRPGDVSLAHRGVLFLDEMPEFPRAVLETLRQPLEDGSVTVARVNGSVRFPAKFMLVGALNPSADGGGSLGAVPQWDRYLSRLSGPLVDRIDLHVEVPSIGLDELTGPRRGTSTAIMRDRVAAARERQHERQGAPTNAELRGRDLDRFAALSGDTRSLLDHAMRELGLSARGYDKIRRVARTIADLDDAETITPAHLAEAVQYRLLDRRPR